MSSIWWCVASGHGYQDCPEELKKSLRRGSRIKAAAWRRPRAQDAEFHIAIVAEIQKCDGESTAKVRYQVDLNTKNGNIGAKLQQCPKIKVLKVFQTETSFRLYFNDFDMIRNDLAPSSSGADSSSALALAPPQDGGEQVDYHAVLGLEQGASAAERKARYQSLVKIWHPDKHNGLGDASHFVAIYEAYWALEGGVRSNAAEGCGVLVCPRQKDVSVSDAHETFTRELESLVEYENQLKRELERVQARRSEIDGIMTAKGNNIKREQAETFVKRFQKSARYWEPADLKCWFRPPEVGANSLELDKKYGPDLRSGNEDLDPFVRFQKWYWKGHNVNKLLLVRLGYDNEDAVDNGIDMTLPLMVFWQSPGMPYRTRFEQMGFDPLRADELWHENGFDRLGYDGGSGILEFDMGEVTRVLAEQTWDTLPHFHQNCVAPRQRPLAIAWKNDASGVEEVSERSRRSRDGAIELWGARGPPRNKRELRRYCEEEEEDDAERPAAKRPRMSEEQAAAEVRAIHRSLSDWERAPNLKFIRDRDPEPEQEVELAADAPAESLEPVNSAASLLCSDEGQSHSGLGAVAEEPTAAEQEPAAAEKEEEPTAAGHMDAKWCLGSIHVDMHIHPLMAKRVVKMLIDVLRSLSPRPRDRAGEDAAESVNQDVERTLCASLKVKYCDGHFTIMDNEHIAASASIKQVE